MEGYKISTTIKIPVAAGSIKLTGDLNLPEKAKALVIFSHGSGSSRLSSRNRYVASRIREKGIGTLLFDLLTEEEDLIYENRFDIELLTDRLIEVLKWARSEKSLAAMHIGLFGASTGAASALKAAARTHDVVKAVVSRGGRPDLALRELPDVKAPTRLIVGGRDFPVIGMNETSINALGDIPKDLMIVAGATHLFEEPGKLDEAADLAIDWFERYLH